MSFGLLALGAILAGGLLLIGVAVAIVLLLTGGKSNRDRPSDE